MINNHLGNLGNYDYVVIDEIGPLEIIKKQGFTNAIKILEDGNFQKVIVALRPSLVERLKQNINKNYEIKVLDAVENPDLNVLIN